MKKILIILFSLLISTNLAYSQENEFSNQIELIGSDIDSITIAEKEALKSKIKLIDEKVKSNKMALKDANKEKIRLARISADSMRKKIKIQRKKLSLLLDKRLDDRIGRNKNYNKLIRSKKRKIKIRKGEKRTTSQVIFAVGLNTLSSENGLFPDNLKVWSSRFWEYGYTLNTRLSNQSNLLHIKYGVSLVYNNLRPESNYTFVKEDKHTTVKPTDIEYEVNRFRNFYLNFPLHFELDFSPMRTNKKGDKIFISHRGFRVGFGGYIGVLINSKNFYEYKEGKKKISYSVKENFNVNDFNYGLSAYIGHRQFSVYSKYDLQALFENNIKNEHNFSLGFRWDFN